MKISDSSRREFLRTAAMGGAVLALSSSPFPAGKRSVLVFTKSSAWEHDVVKTTGRNPSIVERAIRELGKKNGFEVDATKDGRIFNSKEFRAHSAIFFFTTGDLTKSATDAQPPMTEQGKKALLDAVADGLGFVGVHAASDTFHTQPDPEDRSNRYIAHGESSDPYLRMLGGEFITHGSEPRLQTANLIVNDPNFPGLQGVKPPVSFNEEWYSLKDFATDMHVILTLDTHGMSGECYQRPPYPVTWARLHNKGRVFYTAMGDRSENWQNTFFLDQLGGGIRWAAGEAKANLNKNLTQVAPGFAQIPPQTPAKK
ncbi:MAG: ThuA domain-containing protein [Acidobacteriota bacterium]|nr:ThuA domain-containing protein [Acidobacteriota bacterium]